MKFKYSILDFCSHMRSWRYWAESVADLTNTAFFALNCDGRVFRKNVALIIQLIIWDLLLLISKLISHYTISS